MTGQDVVNTDQAAAWDGDEGTHWVSHQHRYETMTGAFTEPLLDAAAIAATDRILDIGCGCGQTTRLAAGQAPQGHGLGVDLSRAMLDRAEADAADAALTNVRFEQGDAQVHRFSPRAFDVAISRFGIMFFADPVTAFTNIGSALVAGGRLAFLCWQDVTRNAWITVPASAALAHVPIPDLGAADEPGPFSLADPNRISDLLTRAGFTDIETTSVEAPLRLGSDADDAVSFLSGTGIARALLESVDPDTATRALDAIRDALRPYERPDGLCLGGAAWLVTSHRA
ncbi:MAG: class I SAM-dependent methyltransferase [Acidimicrobiales bacterium]